MTTKFDRIIIVAPTRAVCANIVTTLENRKLIPPTLLERECKADLTSAAQRLTSHGGFGLIAGTGTGKTVSLGSMAEYILQTSILNIKIVTREHEAKNLHQANVLVITSGIALNYLKRGLITQRDALFLDEIHETSEALEFALVLLRKLGLTASWMSGTVNPNCFKTFLRSDRVIECKNFDPAREAKTVFERGDDPTPYLSANINRLKQEKRGVAVFVPTRRQAEELADQFRRQIPSFFYHAGTSIKELEPFLQGRIQPPFLVFMTSAGSSGLNIPNLNTVVIVDEEYRETVINGRHVLVHKQIEVNRLLQMAGRVRGRAQNAEVVMLTERKPFRFADLVPHDPDFKLGADLPHLVLACADLGYATRELEFLGTIDHEACDTLYARFQTRGLIDNTNRLTPYGKRVLALPLKPAWGEMVVRSTEKKYEGITDIVILCAAAPPVYSLIRGKKFDPSHVVPGSDHLTLYNVLLDVLQRVVGDKAWDGETLPTRLVYDVAYLYHYEGRALYDALLSLRSICDALNVPLPNHRILQPVVAGDARDTHFRTLLASLRSLETISDFTKVSIVSGSEIGSSGNRSQMVIGETNQRIQDLWGSKVVKTEAEGTDIPQEIMVQTAELVVPIRAVDVHDDGNTVLVSTHIMFDGRKYDVMGSFAVNP